MPELSRYINRLGSKRSTEWLKDVDAKDFLERLNVNNIREGNSDEIQFSCPFDGHSHGDDTPSAYMNNGSKEIHKNTAFKCWGCSRSGNAITFYAEHEGVSRMEASNVLREVYAPNWRAPKGGTIAKEFAMRRKELEEERERLQVQEMPVIDPSLYAPFIQTESDRAYDQMMSYMEARGFDDVDIDEWGIGFDVISKRVTIPVHNPEGELVGVKGRAISKEAKPKYRVMGDVDGRPERYGFRPYEKSRVVFGIDHWGEQDVYVFVEGELDVISLAKMGFPAVATGSAALSDEQARIIRSYCDEVILFLDDDLAGTAAIWGRDDKDGVHHPGIIETLEPFVRVKKVGKHRRDPNDYLIRGESERVKRLIEKAKPSFKLFPPKSI